jgi:malate dehydrogenase (oxaloacetate-decarboxylating)(NADP+)
VKTATPLLRIEPLIRVAEISQPLDFVVFGAAMSHSSVNGRRGVELLHDPLWNKGTAFSEGERDAFGLRGLLPPRVATQETQVKRVLDNLGRKPNDLERYICLMSLQDRNENLFYRVVMSNFEEMMPLIYTPTVGQACQQYGHIFRRPGGLYICVKDRGRVKQILQNWPYRDVRILVVTDGERILGLGDLGANGMGIPVGKLALYTACAGIPPERCLPVMLDMGTNNQSLLNDPLYIGVPERRVRGEIYDDLLDEFVAAAQEVFPKVCIQLEDFGNANAFRVLERYQRRACLFDDDIQGTASVALAGIYAALSLAGSELANQKFLFLGAGQAGIGIANLLVMALKKEGLKETDARLKCWFVDSDGLVVKSRGNLAKHKQPYAHDFPAESNFLRAVETICPTVIIGACGVPNSFTQRVVEAMARLNRRPIILALSNPTSKSECTAEEAYLWSGGRAIFASGSPFGPFALNGQKLSPGQCNNAYVFPGLGLGVMASEADRVIGEMFLAASTALSDLVSDNDLSQGRIFPSLGRIREVSAAIAAAVAEVAFEHSLTRMIRPDDLHAHIKAQMYDPSYPDYSLSIAETNAAMPGSFLLPRRKMAAETAHP